MVTTRDWESSSDQTMETSHVFKCVSVCVHFHRLLELVCSFCIVFFYDFSSTLSSLGCKHKKLDFTLEKWCNFPSPRTIAESFWSLFIFWIRFFSVCLFVYSCTCFSIAWLSMNYWFNRGTINLLWIKTSARAAARPFRHMVNVPASLVGKNVESFKIAWWWRSPLG